WYRNPDTAFTSVTREHGSRPTRLRRGANLQTVFGDSGQLQTIHTEKPVRLDSGQREKKEKTCDGLQKKQDC
ncbi:MAG: hypothetical protein ACI93T_002614, partial [Porticoccaceae bacterium]